MIGSKRIVYLQEISDSCHSQPSRFWGYFNRLSKRPPIPDTIELDGNTFTSPATQAEAFNSYFSSVFNNDLLVSSELPSRSFTDDTVFSITFTKDDVLTTLQHLDPSKSPSPDGLHPKILKECANELAISLCTLFNCSLTLGKLPHDWKWANVTPVFKKGQNQ